ncbi:hypothetical protein AVEN_234767-1 [Araneus ventricosus]|uniref:Uncharacterized protein n=1 Tax=Araneus ventricosus TaxID=182803 RepID=A0A4Y2M0Y3_ARAVE|nr:hypothetical protein AVEN_234767-1 [Araneus ventricosus]
MVQHIALPGHLAKNENARFQLNATYASATKINLFNFHFRAKSTLQTCAAPRKDFYVKKDNPRMGKENGILSFSNCDAVHFVAGRIPGGTFGIRSRNSNFLVSRRVAGTLGREVKPGRAPGIPSSSSAWKRALRCGRNYYNQVFMGVLRFRTDLAPPPERALSPSLVTSFAKNRSDE